MARLDREDITEYFTGPVSQQLVNHSPVPVLCIHPSYNPDSIDLRFY
jgi:nucleotide-binding universal stress UspA family protein